MRALQSLLLLLWMLLTAPGGRGGAAPWRCAFTGFLPGCARAHFASAFHGCSISAVKAGRRLLWFLATGWYQLVSLMTVVNVFFLTQ